MSVITEDFMIIYPAEYVIKKNSTKGIRAHG